jgi:hypothetical protein
MRTTAPRGEKFCGGTIGARQHVAGGAVLGGDAAGEIVDRSERDLSPDQVGVERGEVRVAVDGRTGDDDAAIVS